MNRFVWARSGMAAAVALVVAAGGHVGVANAADDGLALKMASSVRDRVFVRAGAIYVKVKTKAGETFDVAGPNGSVATRTELAQISEASNTAIRDSMVLGGLTLAQATSVANGLKQNITGIPNVIRTMDEMGVTTLGTPPGIKGIASKEMGTAGLSLGFYLDEEQHWVAEAYVLAAPLSTSVSLTGRSTVRIATDPDTGENTEYIKPFGLEGQKAITTKLLPPTVAFGRYWGDKNAKFRPYTGVVAMYAIFYDTKAAEVLNQYVGGTNPGDTTVSFKNTFGFGPALGLKYQFDDKWHLSLNIASVKLKTQATLTTRNSAFNARTPAIQDMGKADFTPALDADGNPQTPINSVADIIIDGELKYSPDGSASNLPTRLLIESQGGLTAVTTKAVQYLRGQTGATYSRKNDTTLTSTIFMLSLGRSF